MPLNPNSARDEVNSYLTKSDPDKAQMYPQFFKKVKLDVFRHIRNLELRCNCSVNPVLVV